MAGFKKKDKTKLKSHKVILNNSKPTHFLQLLNWNETIKIFSVNRVEPIFSLGQYHPHKQTVLRAEELLGSLKLRTWPQVGKCSGQDWWVCLVLDNLESGRLKVAPYLSKLLTSGLKHEAVAMVP